jgi:hypothetical protein
MPDDLGNAQPQRVNLQQLMAGRYFIVPNYQRHFAWRKKECEELFADVVATARNPDRQRFMSTITAIVPAGNSIYPAYTDTSYTELRPFLVVDGQQRLTSLTILIAAICRHLIAEDGVHSSAHEPYSHFVRAKLQDGQEILRLLPQDIPDHPGLMREFFSDVVEKTPQGKGFEHIIPAQKRLKDAQKIFEEGLKNLTSITPANLLTCITSRLIFILNTLSDVGQAGEVFEGINNRGLPLSVLENIKAYAVYAVQSFRTGDRLPLGVNGTSNANELVDAFNNAIGMIYNYLDRVGLKDDDASDLLAAAWPILVSPISSAGLSSEKKGVPDSLDRNRPAQQMRDSLQIAAVQTEEQKSILLNKLDDVLTEKLVKASRFFADARRPMKEVSFAGIGLERSELSELRDLHQRLVEMSSTSPFLPLLIAYRTVFPGDGNGYLLLARAIERAAFWVYVLGDSNTGKGQKLLAGMARRLADGEIGPQEVLKGLHRFAFSKGKSIKLDDDELEDKNLETRLDDMFSVSNDEGFAAVAYEWLLSKGTNLPSYGNFVRRHTDGQSLQLVPTSGRGQLPHGFDNDLRKHMNHPGNIIITRQMKLRITLDEKRTFNSLPYLSKVQELEKIGYKVPLPKLELTAKWADKLQGEILKFSCDRWSFPESGIIVERTWPLHYSNVEYDEPSGEQ